MEKLRQWKNTAGEYVWYFGGEVKQATVDSMKGMGEILRDAKNVTTDVTYDAWNTVLLRPTTASRQREEKSDDLVYAIDTTELTEARKTDSGEPKKEETEKY